LEWLARISRLGLLGGSRLRRVAEIGPRRRRLLVEAAFWLLVANETDHTGTGRMRLLKL